jgi:uncharacterized membrane protein YeaQ/YmgE (transglycosylase-associated protein family)
MNVYLLIGVLLGIILRTVGPYLLQLGKPGSQPFNAKYLLDAVVGAALSLGTGAVVLPVIDPTIQPWMAFWVGLTTAITMQSASRTVTKAVAAK